MRLSALPARLISLLAAVALALGHVRRRSRCERGAQGDGLTVLRSLVILMLDLPLPPKRASSAS